MKKIKVTAVPIHFNLPPCLECGSTTSYHPGACPLSLWAINRAPKEEHNEPE